MSRSPETRANDPSSRPPTLAAFLAGLADQHGEREAVVFEDRRWTYAKLAGEAARVASGLDELGVRPGERIGVLLPNWPEFLACVFGITTIGAVAVGINTLSTEAELAYALELAEVRSLIYTPRFLRHDYQAMLDQIAAPSSTPGEARAPLRLDRRIVVGNDPAVPRDALRYAALGRGQTGGGAAALRALDRATSDTLAMMFFTSGSTARPKAVLHAHRALLYQACVASERFGLTSDDRALCYLPMFFTGGLALVALIVLAQGGLLVLQDHFEAGHALELMERERTTFYAGWQFAPRLCAHESFPRRRLQLRKGIFTDVPEARKLLRPDNVTVGAYGMSETATLCCSGRWNDPVELRQRGFGQPLPGVDVRILDPETGAQLGPGQVGEIALRHPAAMLGYLGVPREETFDADGFFHTGDYGRLDETGSLRFDGRLKEVIRTAGVKVAAAEIENFLERQAGIAAAYVVPVPHPERAENIAAFVVPREPDGLDVDGLLAICRRDLASYKIPRHLFVLAPNEVPRTGTEKVDKPSLRRQAAELAGGPTDLLAARRA
ncbi:MAG TPA: class I adenylate-forming enzyme family protein [Candidatus Bathyarchaeia archaeon]|nr:class I adenylate-forming enzyme family protein [Candidatus Bathyarchaeia archaeon]